MKRLFNIACMIILAAIVVAVATASGFAQQFVALPDPIQASITGLIVALVALVFDFAIGRYSWLSWLRKYQQECALGLAAGFVAWLQNFLPTGYEDVSIKGIAFLLSIIFLFVPYLVVRKMLVARGYFLPTRTSIVNTSTPINTAYRPSTTIQYFSYSHLPAKLQEVSKPIGELADLMEKTLPPGPEKSAGMRKLLEAKDCFVRSALE